MLTKVKHFNPIFPNEPLPPDVFMGVEKECIGNEWVKLHLANLPVTFCLLGNESTLNHLHMCFIFRM